MLGIDEYLLPVREYVASFGGDLLGDLPVQGLEIESVLLDMPMELVVVGEQGIDRLLAAPPTQHLTTAVMPVFHRLRVRMERA